MIAEVEQGGGASASCIHSEQAASFVCNELAGQERMEFERHCHECAECAALVRQFCEVAAVMEGRPRYEPDEGSAERVLARIRREREAPVRSRVLAFPPMEIDFRWIAAAACLAVLGGVSALLVWIAPEPAPSGMPPTLSGAVAAVQGESAGAVRQALDWLAGAQEKNGAWDPAKWKGQKEYEPALTGMALLTFLRQPDATVRARYAKTIDAAVEYLLGQQGADGAVGPDSDGRMYNHGIATVALIEASRLAEDGGLREPVRLAVSYMAGQQLESGGWGYRRRAGEEANTSISVWQLHALKLARETGTADALPAYRRGMRWLNGLMDGTGAFGYQHAGDKPGESDTLTAMGAFCLLGDSRDAAAADVARVRTALRTAASGWARDTDFYRWYFLVNALQISGDSELREALAPVCKSLLTLRNREGEHGGTWEPVGTWSSVGGRIFTTAIATLCLEAGNG